MILFTLSFYLEGGTTTVFRNNSKVSYIFFKGLKANLKRLYHLITEEQFTACTYLEKYKKLLFGLCFFHAILLERKKFQQLGWNVIYSFNDSDFQANIFLNSYLLFFTIFRFKFIGFRKFTYDIFEWISKHALGCSKISYSRC